MGQCGCHCYGALVLGPLCCYGNTLEAGYGDSVVVTVVGQYGQYCNESSVTLYCDIVTEVLWLALLWSTMPGSAMGALWLTMLRGHCGSH